MWCFRDNTPKEKSKFVAFHEPVEQMEARQVFVCLAMNKDPSIEEAIEILEQNNANHVSVRINTHHSGTTNQEEVIKSLQWAIAINTHIKIMHIHLCARYKRACGKFVALIAQGIAANMSIKRLSWHIGSLNRDEIAATIAFCEILTQNTTLKAVSVCRRCREDHTNNVGPDGHMAFLSDHQYATKEVFGALKHNVKHCDWTITLYYPTWPRRFYWIPSKQTRPFETCTLNSSIPTIGWTLYWPAIKKSGLTG
jgi:hypothetical protein